MDVERRALLQQRVGDLEHAVEGVHVGEGAVRDRVQVGEVDHRPHPGELRGDREDVLGRAELADAAHHLDPERHRAFLPLEPLAQLGELLDDVGQRLLARRARAGSRGGGRRAPRRRDRDAGRVVEHPDRHPVLLVALDVAHEAGERRVHGEDDLAVAGELAEALRPRVVHPEPALEVDLAGGVAALQERSTASSGLFREGTRAGPNRIVPMVTSLAAVGAAPRSAVRYRSVR